MLLLQRLFRKKEADPRDALRPLYAQIVATARQPHWFVEGKVADTIEGRFEMVATVLSLVLLRLEGEPLHKGSTALLIELFVEDMDPQLREVGIGDVIVGKHVGRLVGALGGRLGAYREALAAPERAAAIDAALVRNLYAGVEPGPASHTHVRDGVLAITDRLAKRDAETILAGEIG
jgi:cytochrome b pre-mRNA-processing protein 3